MKRGVPSSGIAHSCRLTVPPPKKTSALAARSASEARQPTHANNVPCHDLGVTNEIRFRRRKPREKSRSMSWRSSLSLRAGGDGTSGTEALRPTATSSPCRIASGGGGCPGLPRPPEHLRPRRRHESSGRRRRPITRTRQPRPRVSVSAWLRKPFAKRGAYDPLPGRQRATRRRDAVTA